MGERLYLYGVVNTHEADGLLCNGIEGMRPYIVPFKDLGVIVSTCSGGKKEVGLENLSKHNQVVNEMMNQCTVLPIPFNSIVDNEGAIAEFLSKKYVQLMGNFDRLDNKVEMGLKVAWDYNSIRQGLETESGDNEIRLNVDSKAKAYLQEKMNAYSIQSRLLKKAEFLKSEVVEGLQGIYADCKVSLLKWEKIPFDGAFLVERSNKDLFIGRTRDLENSCKHLSFLLSGPWAPYNFVQLS